MKDLKRGDVISKSLLWLLAVSLLVTVLMLTSCEYDLTTTPTTSLQTTPTTTTTTTSSPPAAHFPEQWSFSDLTVTPSEADIGEEVLVTFWVYVYYVEKPATAYLAIDGEVLATKELYLDTDYTESVSFTVVMEEEGTHEVRCAVVLQDEGPYEVGVNDLVASLTIRPAQK